MAHVDVTNNIIIDNHDSGYLGMVVQLYVQAHLGHYHTFDPEGIQPKTDGFRRVFSLLVPSQKLLDTSLNFTLSWAEAFFFVL